MRGQPNISVARIFLATAHPGQKRSYAHFDVRVALVKYTLRTLFVGFRCSDSKDSGIMCFTYSKYRNNNFPDLKLLFDVFSTLFMNA